MTASSRNTTITSSTSSLLLTAGVLALSYYGLWTLSYVRRVGNPEEEDIITEADVLEILQRLRSGLQQHYEQHVQSIVRQVSGLSAVSESQLQQAVQHEMERKLSELQCQLLHEYEMDRECLEDAIRDLQVESMAVQAAVQDFEKSWSCLLSSSSTTED